MKLFFTALALAALGTTLSADAAPKARRVSRIFDGAPAPELVDSVPRVGGCTGVLVSPTIVLTAAHCAEIAESAGTVAFPKDLVPIAAVRAAVKVVYEPRLDMDLLPPFPDVAVVVLERPAKARNVRLLTERLPREKEQALIYGYGQRNTPTSRRGLNRGLLEIDRVTPRYLVSKKRPKRTGICYGDSGGPLFVAEGRNGAPRWRLAGIAFTTLTTVEGKRASCIDGEPQYWVNLSHPKVRRFLLDADDGSLRKMLLRPPHRSAP